MSYKLITSRPWILQILCIKIYVGYYLQYFIVNALIVLKFKKLLEYRKKIKLCLGHLIYFPLKRNLLSSANFWILKFAEWIEL